VNRGKIRVTLGNRRETWKKTLIIFTGCRHSCVRYGFGSNTGREKKSLLKVMARDHEPKGHSKRPTLLRRGVKRCTLLSSGGMGNEVGHQRVHYLHPGAEPIPIGDQVKKKTVPCKEKLATAPVTFRPRSPAQQTVHREERNQERRGTKHQTRTTPYYCAFQANSIFPNTGKREKTIGRKKMGNIGNGQKIGGGGGRTEESQAFTPIPQDTSKKGGDKGPGKNWVLGGKI